MLTKTIGITTTGVLPVREIEINPSEYYEDGLSVNEGSRRRYERSEVTEECAEATGRS